MQFLADQTFERHREATERHLLAVPEAVATDLTTPLLPPLTAKSEIRLHRGFWQKLLRANGLFAQRAQRS